MLILLDNWVNYIIVKNNNIIIGYFFHPDKPNQRGNRYRELGRAIGNWQVPTPAIIEVPKRILDCPRYINSNLDIVDINNNNYKEEVLTHLLMG